MNIRNNYRAGVDKHRVPVSLLLKTKDKIEQETAKTVSKSDSNRWLVTLPVCCLTAAFTVSLLGYAFLSPRMFSNPSFQPHLTDSLSSDIMEDAGNVVSQTIEKDDLNITIKKTVCDKSTMYITLDVQSKNGTPLQETNEFSKSVLPRDTFAEANLLLDGKANKCFLLRTDDGSVANKASYECLVDGDFSKLNGADATLELKDFADDIESAEDAGFLFNNLGELYKKMTPEKTENFIETGRYQIYANKSLIAKSWTIPAGNNHVAFSSQFPNSYIDNIGFHKTGEYGCQVDVLYISITPGNEEEAAGLKKLCFQNIDTKHPIYFSDRMLTGNGIEDVGFSSNKEKQKAYQAEIDRKLEMNGNRIVIALGLSFDNKNRDCTVSDLDHYRIVNNYTCKNRVRFPGEWKTSFKIQYKDTTHEYMLNHTIKNGDNTMTFKKVTLSDLSITYSGTVKKESAGMTSMNLIMKDGTKVDIGVKIGGGTDADGSFEFSGNLATIVNAGDVVALEMWGQRIPLK